MATTDTLSVTQSSEADFQTAQVLTISGGHLIHDTYFAFLPVLLPLLIEKLSLTLTMAGAISALAQLPALLNPLIGYVSDRLSLRYFVIFAPALTATMMSCLGLAPNALVLAVMLILCGVGSAAFHAPAPAMITRVSGNSIGRGMSLFMAAGELGRTLGPLMLVWAVSLWSLDGYWRIVIPGWAATLILYWRLRSIPARSERTSGLAGMLPAVRRVGIPLAAVTLLRGFVVVCISIYLPTYMSQAGATLWIAGGALVLAQAAGVVGALASGPLSDRLGRKPVLLVTVTGSAIFMLLFIRVDGWVLVPVLLLLGLLALSTQPVLMSIVQEQFPDHRAVANGFYMGISFIVLSFTTFTIGFVGDHYGLETAYLASALLALAALPIILMLPGQLPAKTSPPD
jgi:FSR family fosmidomycin resistance protein-like MFS transporter